MNENDQKIRKQWLIVLALSVLISIVNTFMQLQFNPSLNAIPQSQYWFTASSLLGALGFGFIAYHCAYRKFGTKLLIGCLVISAASIVVNSILYLTGKFNPFVLYGTYYGTFLLMTQGTGILWIVVCWRMLKVNKRLQSIRKSLEKEELS